MTGGRTGKRWLVCVLLALLPALGACSTKRLAPEARESLRIVSIDSTLPVPDEPDMNDEGLAFQGLVGLVASHWIGETRAEQVNQAMARGQVSIAEIVRSEFESALAATGMFQLGGSDECQATFHLEVYRLGMHRDVGFDFDLKPILGIQASLLDPTGKVLWQRKELTHNLNDHTPAYDYEAYIEDPEKLREAFTVAAKLAVADLMKHLRGT